jgi:hypothetical protein
MDVQAKGLQPHNLQTQCVQTEEAQLVRVFDIAKFKQLYQTFDSNTLSQLPKLYDNSIVFKDPIHQITGIKPLTNYFATFCSPETQCQFDFINEVISDSQAFFHWQMHYSHPKLQAGKTLTLNGGTLIKFNSQITYHEDFYDMGAMIYQHIPVLGWAVKKINARITEQSQ